MMLSLCLLLLVVGSFAKPIHVTTKYGRVVGESDEITAIAAFRGIPYAAPPVGKLRFKDPEEVSSWAPKVLNATEFSDGCMAICSPKAFPKPDLMCTPKMSEDCLYLNIFTPNATEGANLPVVLFMHGGNYIGGSGGVPLYDGSDLALHQNVVVVTINYRLGLFGGLYTGTITGNFQTKDQRQSMKWIRAAIAPFGGDPNNLMITGQSAGAFSVATHLSSPPSWGLFHKAVIVSDPFALQASTPELSIKLAGKVMEKVGCPQTGGLSEVDCLQAVPAEELLNVSLTTHFTPTPNQVLDVLMQWVPVVDGVTLLQQPFDALTQGNFDKRVPVMFGTVANESVQFIYDISAKPMGELEYYLFLDYVFNASVAKQITDLYGPLPKKYYKDARDFISLIATDFIFYCPNRAVGRAITKHTPTFMYLFDYVASFYPWVDNGMMAYCEHEVCHADDLAFIFFPFKSASYLPNIPKPWANETKLARTLQSAWGNFAHKGDPNPLAEVKHGVAFPRFNGTENVLVNYSIPSEMISGYRDNYCAFWDKIGYHRR